MTHSLSVFLGDSCTAAECDPPTRVYLRHLCEHRDADLLRPSLHYLKQNPGQTQLLVCEAETFQDGSRAADDRCVLEHRLGSFEEGRWASFSTASCLTSEGPNGVSVS